jgi:hypothetical protein
MDLNIFFSSLAQGVGGLVGIFAAFIITKIINNQAEFDRKKSKVEEEMNDSARLRDVGEVLNFHWFNKWQLKFQLDLVKTVVEEGTHHTPEEFYEMYSFPEYLPRSEVLKAIAEKMKQPPPGARPFAGLIPSFETRDFVSSVNKEGERIENFFIDARNQTRIAKSLLSEVSTNPESSKLVSFSIVATTILFYTGFIYPLSFLPLSPGQDIAYSFWEFFPILFSLRGLLLFIPSVVFTVTILVFFLINLQLKYPAKLIKELGASTKMGYFSPFFNIRLQNEKERSRWEAIANKNGPSVER